MTAAGRKAMPRRLTSHRRLGNRGNRGTAGLNNSLVPPPLGEAPGDTVGPTRGTRFSNIPAESPVGGGRQALQTLVRPLLPRFPRLRRSGPLARCTPTARVPAVAVRLDAVGRALVNATRKGRPGMARSHPGGLAAGSACAPRSPLGVPLRMPRAPVPVEQRCDHLIDKMRGGFRHAPSREGRTEASTLAGEGHEEVMAGAKSRARHHAGTATGASP